MPKALAATHHPQSPAPGRRAGFSIIELVVVASVIAIGAAIAIPRYSASTVRYRLDAAARRVAADLDRARTAARIGSTTRTLSFSSGTISYSVDGESSLRRGGETYHVALGEEPYRAQAVAASFGGSPMVSFNAFGLPSSGGQVTLRIGSDERTITVNADTGKADIQ
jgi:prepilin-type N-terminal cleavage/methylation domain-containing protein